MRVAFLGTPHFAVPTLDALHRAGHEICAVVAQPDKPVGRGQSMASPPTVVRARELGVPVYQPTKLKSGDFPGQFAAVGAEVAVVVAYGRILPPALLEAPRRGCINVHASLLPRWRGAAPIQWSILAGDSETGITTMQMAEGLDTGDILLQRRTPIGAEETSGQLHDRLATMGAELLVDTLARLDGIVPCPQPEVGVTYAKMLDREMSSLDWTRTAVEIDRQVRGLSPWPGTASGNLKVLRARPVAGAGLPGTLLDGARVACGEGAIELLEVQVPGKKAVSGRDWMNGARLRPGDRVP
ncbi:MAG: methionyl-tRNA formyltransferase [Deltaproteobacteria bacterium]|nr:methionyl-tRNA formyltransferase [Deltaproteobacteria bacterium]